MKRKICSFVAVAVVIAVIVTCFFMFSTTQAKTVKKYVLPKTFSSLDSGVIASNENFELEWDNYYKCVLLRSKQSGKVWSTTPYKTLKEGKENALLSSPIVITASDVTNRSLTTVRAYSASIVEGEIESKKIDNGIEVVYYFDDLSISIPVRYSLRNDSLSISLENKQIAEGEQFSLLNVQLAPMFCSVENGNKDDYLFLPSGTGGLMSTVEDADGIRYWNGQVYGDDQTQNLLERLVDQEPVKMPVFGVKAGDSALLGIIEQAPGSSIISAEGGNNRTGYSTVYADVYVRGYDMYETAGVETSSISTLASENLVDATTVIGFYPLENDKADYNGMADCYRDYLIKNGMKKSDTKQEPYALTILGNIQQKELTLGVPVTEIKSLTSFSEAQQIVKELSEKTEIVPDVKLLGYGEYGIDTGKIAGGFDFASESGSDSDYESLTNYIKSKGALLFTDFDLLYFSKTGSGITTLNDPAKSSSMKKSEIYKRTFSLRGYYKEDDPSYLVKQDLIADLSKELVEEGKDLGVSSYSLSTLGNTAYSDFSNAKNGSKAQINVIAQNAIKNVKKAGKVATSDANDYAAMVSDSVFDVTVKNWKTNGIKAYIPFYQMVFKSYTSLYSESLNLMSNMEEAILSSLESGVGLGFTVLKNYDIIYGSSLHENMYSSQYHLKKNEIVALVNQYKEYYEKIADAGIEKVNIISDGVTQTVFDNGVVAYTNRNNFAVKTPNGQLEAKSFIYIEKGGNTVE